MNIRAKIFGGKKEAEPWPLLSAKKPRGAKADALHSIAVSREETRRGDTRGGDRHRLPKQAARVTHEGVSHDVQLINLSGGGAMVEGGFAPKLWDRVDLHLGDDGVIECAVRWLRDNRVGLEFAHETRIECSADEQASLLRDTINRSFPDIEFETPDPAPAAASQNTRQGDGRRERRHPLIWSGVVHHDYQSTTVRLRNISSTGALIECEEPLRVGAEPLLDLGEAGTIFATVTWRVGDQAGLRFHESFDLAQLSRAKPQVAPSKWNTPAYLKSDPVADTPWAQQWGRMTVGELRDELEGYMKH